MEYADLHLGERLALLQALLEQALDCELVRELITSNVEAMALPRQKKPVRCSACCICVVADAAISANANCLTCRSSDVCLHENRHAVMSAYRMMYHTSELCTPFQPGRRRRGRRHGHQAAYLQGIAALT